MADQQLARPSSVLENPGVLPPRGINRNNLTLALSIAAIILSVAASGVALFRYVTGEQPKMASETALADSQRELVDIQKVKEKALADAAQLDVALKAQQIRTGAAQEQEALAAKINHVAAATNNYSSARNNDQDTAKKRGETVSAQAKGYLDDEVLLKSGIVPMLADSVRRSVRPDGNVLGMPSMGLPRPVSGGARASVPDPWSSPSVTAAATDADPFPKRTTGQ
jgi:hypothetical protein